MNPKKSIHFILNPISGRGQNQLNIDLISTVLNKQDYEVVLKVSQHKNNIDSLTKRSIKENADIIVACGGDGTINKVATHLVNTQTPLGIMKFGSGNGLAAHLGIPNKFLSALEAIKNQNITKIDVGVVNQHFFFSNMSIGVGAKVINHYTRYKKRQFISYLRATLKALWAKIPPLKVELDIDGIKRTVSPLVFFVSNSNEMGFNVSFTPNASLQDGKLDVVLSEQLSFFQKLRFVQQIVFMKNKIFNKAEYFLAEQIKVTNKDENRFLIQLDGESAVIDSKELEISVRKAALNVIVPEL